VFDSVIGHRPNLACAVEVIGKPAPVSAAEQGDTVRLTGVVFVPDDRMA
jgi:hypothetical protein